MLRLTAARERHRLAAPFRISRGVKTEIEVVAAEIAGGPAVGRGEGVPYPRYGESPAAVLQQVLSLACEVERGLTRRELLEALSPGSARAAVDAALWDMEGRALAAGAAPAPVVTALTVSLDEPAAMAVAAAALAHAPLLKVKVDARAPEAQIRAVRAAAPRARLIVDPNESWSIDLLRDLQGLLSSLGVALVEQPLPAEADEALEGFPAQVPICADESCHVAADLDRLEGRYQAVNIKLDKSGGLTAALDLYREARARGLLVMVGCMICTSRSIAPAQVLAARADFVDLDGPLWLRRDHAGGVRLQESLLQPASAELWNPGAAGMALHSLGL
ncbi:MAG TPA: N-acetyl-D-Glu racemase DgcA [Caulobacteraceae bacterium]|jgi:L-alanine-DL-glutamate epimerase-like enolase superfamily enzyme